MRLFSSILVVASLSLSALAQSRFAAEPTLGLSLPAQPLAGDHQATAISVNPGGLNFLRGTHFDLVLTELDPNHSPTGGRGFGAYFANTVRSPFGGRFSTGLAFEQLRPPRGVLAPDPGTPARFSLSQAFGGRHAGVGFTWHHFFDDGGSLDDVDTFDLGLSTRLGAHAAFGLVVRDIGTPNVSGSSVQRRYDSELVLRPLGTDRLELAAGVELGETRENLDPRGRVSWRVTDGLRLALQAAWQTHFRLLDHSSDGGATESRRDWVATVGMEVSFGNTGISVYGTGGRDAEGDDRILGGTVALRLSSERLPSVLARAQHLVKVELGKELSERQLALLIVQLGKLEEDDTVDGVVFSIDGVNQGWATVEELRDAISRLRQHGKKTVATLVTASTRDYYLASAAEKVWIDPAGGIRLQGMASTVLFFKELFDKVGVLAQFEKIEEYKSAPEAFTRSSQSDESRAMHESLLDDIYSRVVADLARDRHLSPAQVKAIVEAGPYTAAGATEKGLVDAAAEPDEMEKLLEKEMGGRVVFAPADLGDRANGWARPQLAVIRIEGDIVDGKSMTVPFGGERLVGGGTIAEAITRARLNPRVRAIVLRIDTPGGSALASEVISRAVFETRGKKPILVSMGDVAASGGYFSAAGGDLIFAEPETITGSIGIFSGKFDLSALLHRIGFTWETTVRGVHADMDGYYRPYTDEERARLKAQLRYYYERFTGAVAKGRQMDPKRVDELGRGRVWTGAQAKERGLVDRLGGLSDALAEARKRAGLSRDEPVDLLSLPEEPTSLVAKLLQVVGAAPEQPTWSPLRLLLRSLPASILLGNGTPQARLPVAIEWE